MDVAHGRGLECGNVEGAGLVVIVVEHLRRDVVGHFDQQGVALLESEVPVVDEPIEQDLEIDLAVRTVHSSGVVDEVGVDLAPGQGVLDSAGPA